VNAESKYLIEGYRPEIESVFENTDINFYSRGSQEGKIAIGVGAGIEARIDKNWSIFANAKYYAAQRYESISGNAGVRYSFGKKQNKEAAQYDSSALEEAKTYADSAVKKVNEADLLNNAAAATDDDKIEKNKAKMLLAESAASDAEISLKKAKEAREKLEEFSGINLEKRERINTEISNTEENAAQSRLKAQGLVQKAKLDMEKAEEDKRIKEEAAIKQEISDAQLAKEKAQAQERRKKEVIKAFNLTLNFKTGSYFLQQESKEHLAEIAEDIKNYEYKKITIEGHTDNIASKEINKKLSRQRAKSVYDELNKAGIPKDKMTYTGFAYEMPIKSNSTREGRAANRRTEIFVE
jgi:outer membrane protein OmpA-like peptidoglycan-associated protein